MPELSCEISQKKLVNETAILIGIFSNAGREDEARDAAEILLRGNSLPELTAAVNAAL
jgi:hypothetical protein